MAAFRRCERGSRAARSVTWECRVGNAMENYRMISIRRFRFAMLALVPMAAISLGLAAAQAQPAPAASTPATPAPAASPTPTPAPTATPAPPPAETKSPADTPSAEQTPASPPPAAPVQTADPFGEEIVLAPKKVVIIKGTANWDSAFDTLIDSFKSLSALLDKQSIARRQSDDRLHLDRRYRVHFSGGNAGRSGAEEPRPRT